MTVFRKFKNTAITFDELDYGEFFSYNNKDIIFLKVYDTISNKDLAIVIDDPSKETSGEYRVYQFSKDIVVDQVYSADLYLYD